MPSHTVDVAKEKAEARDKGKASRSSNNTDDPEQQPLKGQDEEREEGDAATPEAMQARGPNACWTCAVERPLRSKHCQVPYA